MSTIDLADVKVSYEGQTLPVTTLISKLQTQLQEATCRIAAISSTLGDLQAALLNSTTVEVKLTLTREDYGRFRSLEGADDHERIRRAVMVMIHSGEGELSSAGAAAEPRPEAAKGADPGPSHELEMEGLLAERILQEQPAAEAVRIKATTRCPRCQSLIELPDTSNDQWSVEIKCGNCGTKYLVKTKADAPVKNQTGT
jgi:DNA-directed RNA polymerase subunit RPC12/RpoP